MLQIDDVGDPQIGKTYMVRVGWPETGTIWASHNATIPLLGPIHEDAELINFPEYHYHVDWRFAPKSVYEHCLRMERLIEKSSGPSRYSPEDRLLAKTVTSGGQLRSVVTFGRATEFRPRRMLRVHHVFPRNALWMRELEAKYEHARMKNWICPHRGISCSGGQVFEGAVVCPGHGLRFNVATGALARRLPRL